MRYGRVEKRRYGQRYVGPWHILIDDGGPLCGTGNTQNAALTEGMPDRGDRPCKLCRMRDQGRQIDQYDSTTFQKQRVEAWACAQLMRRCYPWFRQTDRHLAEMVSLFVAELHGLTAAHPDRDKLIEHLRTYLLDRLAKEGYPQDPRPPCAVERRWYIRQAAPRPQQRTRREVATEREIEEVRASAIRAIRVRCHDCGQLPDDCECWKEQTAL